MSMAASQKSLTLCEQHELPQVCTGAFGGHLGLWGVAVLAQHVPAHTCHENDTRTEKLKIRPLVPWEGNTILPLISCLAPFLEKLEQLRGNALPQVWEKACAEKR